MINLLLAILSSTLISVLMRLGDSRIKNDMFMFMSNYGICMVCALWFMRGHAIVSMAGKGIPAGMAFAIGIGLLNGLLYLVNFTLLHLNINRNGVVLSSMFMRLGVLVPTAMAILLFHEKARIFQILGFALAIVAIVLINLEKGEDMKKTFLSRMWLFILLFMSGLTDSLANVYDKKGMPLLKDHYLLFTFLAAFFLSIVFARIRKQKFSFEDILWGLAIGIPNYFSARFLLLALATMPAIVVYPVYNVATILAISLFGVFLFKEKMGRIKQIGLVIILIDLILLNL